MTQKKGQNERERTAQSAFGLLDEEPDQRQGKRGEKGEGRHIKCNSLPLQALVSVLDPRIRAIGTVLPQLNPLLTERTEHAVGLDLADQGV